MSSENPSIIDINYGMKEVIESEIAGIGEEFVLLVVVSPKNYEESILSFMDIFLNDKKLFGTYITTNKPFRKIMQNFLSRGIKADNLFFIDAVTREEIPQKSVDGIKVFSSQNVTEINVLLDKAIKDKNKGGQFIFLDSVSTLLVYNDEKTVEKFVHSLIERIYRWKTKGVFITVETNANKMVIENLSLFFDKIVRLDQ
jgi:archaellum biogenesis ATPase FlaH